MTYTSLAEARTALASFDAKRKDALTRARQIAEDAAAGRTSGGADDEKAYQDANAAYDEASKGMREARGFIDPTT